MKLKEYYFPMVKDLADTSLELVISSHWQKDGFSEEDYREWLKVVSRFLRFLSHHVPADLVKK